MDFARANGFAEALGKKPKPTEIRGCKCVVGRRKKN